MWTDIKARWHYTLLLVKNGVLGLWKETYYRQYLYSFIVHASTHDFY